MTPKTRKAAIAKIHIAVQQLGMTEEAYRAMLVNVGGVRPRPGERPSSKELSDAGIDAVCRHLETLGFVPTRPRRAGRKPRMTSDRQALLDKIDAYLAEAGRSMAYADGIARRMYTIDKVAWCNAERLRGIVAALDKDARRAGRDTG